MMKVLVIGGGAAGMSAAAKLKRNLEDAVDIVAFEKGVDVSHSACGIPYYVGGHVDDAKKLVARTPEEFAKSGIDVKIRHAVTAVDLPGKKVTVRNLGTGETFTRDYDKLIVGSGARVRKFPPFDVEGENLCVVSDIQDGVKLKRRLDNPDTKNIIVVGASFTGLEIAEACVRRGKSVAVVEFAERVLPVMDPEISEQLLGELERHMVAVKTASKVIELVCDGNRITSVVVEDAKKREHVPADLVVNCSGIIPNAEFIDVAKAGNGAIIVNERMETSAPDVYAGGDCSIMTSSITGDLLYVPLGTNANKQGKIIAEVISGKPARAMKLVGSSALRLFDLDAAKVGLSETEARRFGLDYRTNFITGNSSASYYLDQKLFIKLTYDAKTRVILGAQLVGQGTVVPRANYYAIAITCNMTVDAFGYLDLCYSPPFSGVWDISLTAAATAK